MMFEFGTALLWAIVGLVVTIFAVIIDSPTEFLPLTLFCFGVSQAWLIAGFVIKGAHHD